MSEMIERVARAIASNLGDHMRGKSTNDIARAAIEEMREPTVGMLQWGPYISDINPNVPNITESQADACWQAMIDAALK